MNFTLPDLSNGILDRHDLQDRARFAQALARREENRALRTQLSRLQIDIDTFASVADVAESERLERQISILESQQEPPSISGAQLHAALKRHPGVEWQHHPVQVKTGKGETPRARLTSLDGEIDALVAERKAIARKTNPTFDEMLQNAKALIAAQAAKGQPKISAGGALAMPSVSMPAKLGHSLTAVPDGVALVCWLFQEQLEAKIESMLELNASDKGMSSADRKAALADIDARLMTLHRERAAIVEMAVASGTTLFHRPDAPFEAVLQISN